MIAVLRWAAAAAIVSILVPPTAWGQCPGGTFNYGAPPDPMAAAVVFDHHGATGSLLAPPDEYARALRDIGLLRRAFPFLQSVGHSRTYAPGTLIVVAHRPFTQELECANQYYGVVPQSIGGTTFIWAFPFPVEHFNALAMAQTYRALPGVEDAGPNLIACAGWCCDSTWNYQAQPDGVWHWTIRLNQPLIGGCNNPESEHEFYTTADGAALPACYPNCDGSAGAASLNAADFMCFLNKLAAGDGYANCDSSTTAPVLNINDFICFQQKFAAGCP